MLRVHTGWNPTQLCGDYFIIHEIRIPTKQPAKWLVGFYKGWNSTQLYDIYRLLINHYFRILTKQPAFNGERYGTPWNITWETSRRPAKGWNWTPDTDAAAGTFWKRQFGGLFLGTWRVIQLTVVSGFGSLPFFLKPWNGQFKKKE